MHNVHLNIPPRAGKCSRFGASKLALKIRGYFPALAKTLICDKIII